ncbi:MBL fold metallo-hydrolase [Jannaschia ovalis]|uniref:MBL fold metallo-hydrolase n=1 Tax=Jannaschia ovalis TaxID=3038773 RepID=A0ABY8LDN4_9RHOB|nr:MBL fold metallo-hydrolase [Jannaschia sp. GRR-S6-38]WGH78298.1 MBL fold metallo-hydrolase [Jannaschia sp. GRR-S6-38]
MGETYPAPGPDGSGLRAVLAPNPSPMTQAGTNSWILGQRDVAVIDPGPADPAHLAALLRAVDDRPLTAILVTHSHLDHSPAARPLAEATGAPVLAFGPSEAGRTPAMAALRGVAGGEGVDPDFRPDRALSDGEEIAGAGWSLRAHWTPGHMANHMAFEWIEAETVFTGDTVMGWASTLISPPDGDLGQFMESLDRLAGLGARRFLPGHGAAVDDPAARCRDLRRHREARSRALLAAMDRPVTIPALVARVYADTPPALHPAAARNVLAHLIELARSGHVAATPGLAPDATWRRL